MDCMETTVTIKYDKGYDAPWVVFKGGVSQITGQMASYFGLSADEASDLTPHELTVICNGIAQGKGKPVQGISRAKDKAPATTEEAVENVKNVIGGEVVADSAWDGVDDSEPTAAPDHAALIAALNAADDLNSLKRLWAENKPAFEDSAVKSAYNARGKALKAAA